MSPAAEELFRSALALPESERVELAEALLATSEHPPAPELSGDAYLAELRRRSADTGEGTWSSWEDARRRVHAKVGLTGPDNG